MNDLSGVVVSMTQHTGFLDDEHEAAFRDGNRLYRRGGPNAPVCGARTRKGSACQNPPIREGAGRCLNHAGPHAARAHREQQHENFLSGKINAEEWNKAEAKRAANRLGWEWKKDPWLPGVTIDLGEHENRFRSALSDARVREDELQPAITDWLRWKFQRFQIDRQDGVRWADVVRVQLSQRLKEIGPRPGPGPDLPSRTCPGPLVKLDFPSETEKARSKRHLPDELRAPKLIRGKGYGRQGRPRTQAPKGNEMEELMEVYRANRITLAPLLERCRSEGERLAVLRALRDYLADPNSKGPRQQWHGLVHAQRAA